MNDMSSGDNLQNSGASASAGNLVNAVPQQIQTLKTQPANAVVQSSVIAKPISSVNITLAVTSFGNSSINRMACVPGSAASGVKVINMQNLMYVQTAKGVADSTVSAAVASSQIGQSSMVKVTSDNSAQMTPISLQRGNLIIGNRIVQCIVSNASSGATQSSADSINVGQNQINSNSNVQLKLIQPVQSNDGSVGQMATTGASNVASVRAPAASNIRMSAVLTPGMVRTLLTANVNPNIGLQPRLVSSTSQQQIQQRLQSLQPGAVTVQIVRPPAASIQTSSVLQTASVPSTPSVLGTATSSNLNIRLPNSAMPIRTNTPQKKIVLVANTSGNTGCGNITYLATNAGQSQNKSGQQLPVTLLATPNSGTGNVRYIAIRGGVPLQLNSAQSAVVASSAGTRVVGPNLNATVVNQALLTSSANNSEAVESGKIVQQVVHGSKIDIQEYLRKVKEQQSQKSITSLTDKTLLTINQPSKGGVQLASSKSVQVIQPTQLQSTSFSGIKAGTSVQMIGSQESGSQATTIYIITNNNSSSTLTAVSGSGPEQLVQTKALSISGGLGATAIRPKVVTVGQGGRTIQVVARDSGSSASATVVPVFVDGQNVKLTKAQQNQKKANKIVAEAIAKAQAEGKDLDSCDADGKRKRKRKAEGTSEDDPMTPKKSRVSKPKSSRSVKKGNKKGETSGSADDGESEIGTESEKSKTKTSKRPPKKKKRPLPTFLKKKKKKTKDDSDASDVDLGTPSAMLLDGEDSLQMRRSSRVVKRKKYVDDLDLNLSDDNSNDEEKPDQTTVIDECDRLATATLPADGYEDYPAEEDAQIVEKILGMRVGKRKIVPHPTHASQKIEAADIDTDVDVEYHDERKLLDRRSSLVGNLKEIEVEEFYVKYKNYSFLHCEWRTADELLAGDKRIPMKIKRYKLKRALTPFFSDVDEEDLFNPDYIEVDRILDVAVTVDPVTNETVTHYLVTWRSLPYEDATWELEQDVEQNKIDMFMKLRDPPTDSHCWYKQRPAPKEWKALAETLEYKNGNTLREYQLEGLNWLTFSYYNRQNCILADEMGLGKTIQSITFLHQVFEYGIRGPFLIVVPLSTVGNWQREFEAWTDINVIVYHGSLASRNMLRKYEMYYFDDKGNKRTDVYKFHALVTTYEVIISDFDELSQIDWRVAVIDEAHRLKNRNCKLLQGLSCFELEHRLLLTGTPLQNNVDELFSLLSFLEPRQFSSSEAFLAEFGKLETESQVDKLKALLKPMMLRRLKEDVEKSLAPKEETIVEVELTNIQKKYYRAILERNFSFLAKGGTSANIPNLMNTMMELRKCCNHPYLINGAEDQILEELNVFRGETEKLFHAMIHSSGKLVLVDKLLPKLKADGHKVLIFSQMIRVLDIIEDYLLHQHYAYERIDGRIRGNLRQEAIDRFSKPESDRFVFLLCTRAGGLGINLTAADTVIIFDSDWNPQNDLQAQARCHRIGQMKAVKVYRLITRNTYEREMFDRASLKLGLDKAVLQSMGNKEVSMQNQLSKKEIEDLLKKGAYGALMDDDNAAEEFCEEDIDHILQRRTQVIQIEAGVKGSTFAKASFNMSSNRSDINIDDPNFWQKWAKKVDLDMDDAASRSGLIMDVPRQRKVTARYGKQDNIVNMSELDSSNSDSDDGDDNPAGGRRLGKRKKRGKSSKDHSMGKVKFYTRSDCFKVEKNLLVYGWGRWQDILVHGRFKHKLRIDDVITITRAMLMFSLQHYEGDERIKKFIYDLISPSEDGKEKDYKNHLGLSAPVPRGRKGKKVKKDVMKKAQFDEDLTKLDIDVDSILIDDGYKKHLKRQSNKVLLRVRLLYYLKQEVIGRQAEKIFSGAHANEIDVPVLCADVDIPVYWWDAEADRCLLVGVFKHGYEKYNQMRQDPKLCFLSRCGPPDCKALLAEQNDDDEMKDDDDEDEAKPRRRGRKKKHKKSKKTSNCDDFDESSLNELNSSPFKAGEVSENGKLPFPSASDLNTRFRRIITSYQRSHKQGMLKLEQVAKKMHRREQLKEGTLMSEQYIAPTDLQSMHLEGVGGNPLLLAEQLNWTRREEADFYRVVSTFGVERDCTTGQFIWDNFRNLGRLERKLDDTLTEYFKAFYHMCMKVCDRFRTEEEARPPNGLYVMPITAERANRCLARIDLLSKIREHILFHPRLDERLSICQPSSYLPDWWICGMHDKDLLVGAAKHGVSRTDYCIQQDPHLTFQKYAQMYAEQNAKDQETSKAANESRPSSPSALKKTEESLETCKTEPETNSEVHEAPKIEKLPDEQVKVELHEEKIESKSCETSENVDKKDPEVIGDGTEDFNANGPDTGPNESVKGLGTNEEENVAAVAPSFNNLWPKDRIIFHRLENICYCVENGKWKNSRHHHNNSQLQVLDSSCNTPSAGMSMPGTPVGSGHDYTIVTDNQVDGFKFKLQKRRRRRTKAEIEAVKGDERLIEEDSDMRQETSLGFVKKKRAHKTSMDALFDGNEDQDIHIPVVNQLDGSRLSGDEAPTLRELSVWLDEHPEYVIEKQLIGKNLHSEGGFGQKQHRRPRLDPSKLSLEDITGDENVTVVNRNTGKRITGAKAPTLRHLNSWLVRNPGFDIDPKWAHIVRQMGNLPEELASRFAMNSVQQKSVPMVSDMRSEELYKNMYLAQLAAMSEHSAMGLSVKGLTAVEPSRSFYTCNLARMGLNPADHGRPGDDDSTSESRDSSSPKPSTSAFIIPSSMKPQPLQESSFPLICDPVLYGQIRDGLSSEGGRRQVAHLTGLQAAFLLEQQRRQNPVDVTNSADTGFGNINSPTVSRTSNGLSVGTSSGSQPTGTACDATALGNYIDAEQLMLSSQEDVWESDFGSRLKIPQGSLDPISQETYDDSSDSSDDESGDD